MMTDKDKDTWYVSFEAEAEKRAVARVTQTFRNELEAKEFARTKLAQSRNVIADTLNPHLPKRMIAPAQMLEWLEEP